MRRHLAVSAVLVVLIAGCGSSSRSSGESRAADAPPPAPQLLAPRVPDGWFVSTAVARHVKLTPVQTLYARSGSDPAHDAGLLIAEIGQDADVATPALDAAPVEGLGAPGGRSARIAHFGDYGVVIWDRVPESTTLAISRGLSDAQLVAAARGAAFRDSGPTVTKDSLPDGFEAVATASLLPRQRGATEQRIWLADTRWNLIQMSMSDLDDEAVLVDRFLADYPGIYADQPGRERTIGGRNVFVRGQAPDAVIDAVAQSIAPVSAQAWEGFRRRVLAVPDALLFAGCRTLRGIVVIGGVRGKVRWGVAVPTPHAAKPCSGVARFEVGDDANGPGGIEGPAPAYGTGPGAFGITVLASEVRSVGLTDASLMVGGSVPAETTRVVVGSGPQEIDATVVDAPDHAAGDPRYFGAYMDLDSLRDDTRVTAYAADGGVVGRFVAPTF